jgi:hypothetical protein
MLYPRNDVPTADDDLTKMGFLNLLTLVQPTIQTNLNGSIFFDGFAGALRFRKKFEAYASCRLAPNDPH